MAIQGGGRAARCALTLVTTTLVASLAACAPAIDQAQSVQTRIGRIPDVAATRVTPPSAAQAGTVSVDLLTGSSVAEVLAITEAVTRAADDEGFNDYRLTLREAGAEPATLVVDGDFAADPRAVAVVGAWQRLQSALLGAIAYTHQPDAETIAVTTPGGLLRDVVESARIGYGTATTTWRFTDGPSRFVDDGRLGPRDVVLLQRVQRTVASPSLPLGATGWHLETRDTQVLLDLSLALPGPVDPSDFTRGTYARPLRLLVEAAVDALDLPGRDLVVRLVNPGHDGSPDDVVGWWLSARATIPGRDPLRRGWDAWLRRVAVRALAAGPT